MYYEIAGVSSVIVYFGELIDDSISQKVLAYYHRLKTMPLAGLIEIIPSYTTLYIEFDIFIHTHESLFEIIRDIKADDLQIIANTDREAVTIPVYYDPEVGLDLERIAKRSGISVDEVIALHTQPTYRVYTIGFAPGFAYMGSAHPDIATPRLSTPRVEIPKGSVAIANRQCAVYPLATPGGWNILGRTYLEMFDKQMDRFSLLRAGDLVRFEPISRDEFVSKGGIL
jgi:KipI family sensor histidine kinase inhibitor